MINWNTAKRLVGSSLMMLMANAALAQTWAPGQAAGGWNSGRSESQFQTPFKDDATRQMTPAVLPTNTSPFAPAAFQGAAPAPNQANLWDSPQPLSPMAVSRMRSELPVGSLVQLPGEMPLQEIRHFNFSSAYHQRLGMDVVNSSLPYPACCGDEWAGLCRQGDCCSQFGLFNPPACFRLGKGAGCKLKSCHGAGQCSIPGCSDCGTSSQRSGGWLNQGWWSR